MVKNFEDMQKLGKDNMDAMQTSLGALSKVFQTIAVEMADYSRKAFEDSSAAAEKGDGAIMRDSWVTWPRVGCCSDRWGWVAVGGPDPG